MDISYTILDDKSLFKVKYSKDIYKLFIGEPDKSSLKQVLTTGEIKKKLCLSSQTFSRAINHIIGKGLIKQIKRGKYELISYFPKNEKNDLISDIDTFIGDIVNMRKYSKNPNYKTFLLGVEKEYLNEEDFQIPLVLIERSLIFMDKIRLDKRFKEFDKMFKDKINMIKNKSILIFIKCLEDDIFFRLSRYTHKSFYFPSNEHIKDFKVNPKKTSNLEALSRLNRLGFSEFVSKILIEGKNRKKTLEKFGENEKTKILKILFSIWREYSPSNEIAVYSKSLGIYPQKIPSKEEQKYCRDIHKFIQKNESNIITNFIHNEI